MGLFDKLTSGIGGGDARPACPSCAGALDPGKPGSYWCAHCGRLYRDEGDGVLMYLPPGYLSRGRPSGRTCVRCDHSLDAGDHYMRYEDGSNNYAYIICPSCKHKNIQYGFGEDD